MYKFLNNTFQFLQREACFYTILYNWLFSGEDGSEASSAGQMETFLGVKGLSQVYIITLCF